jgi:hypothetical protein
MNVEARQTSRSKYPGALIEWPLVDRVCSPFKPIGRAEDAGGADLLGCLPDGTATNLFTLMER